MRAVRSRDASASVGDCAQSVARSAGTPASSDATTLPAASCGLLPTHIHHCPAIPTPAQQLRAVLTDLLHDVANPVDDEHWILVMDVVAAVRVRDVYGTGKQPGQTVLSG
jgi:hypothetical protein